MSTSGGHPGAPDGTPSRVTLPPHEWTAFHDVQWPGVRWGSLDHVVVGPPGVFVVDSSHLSGTVGLRDGRLLQDGRPADDLLSGPVAAALAVGERLRAVDVAHVVPVLCLATDQPLAGTAGGVLVCSTPTLATTLLARPPVLDAERRRLVVAELRVLDRNDGWSPYEAIPRHERGRRRWLWSRRRGLVPLLFLAGVLVLLRPAAALYDDLVGPSGTGPRGTADAGCAELNATHPHGVGRGGARDLVADGEQPVTTYAVDPQVYGVHERLDTDGDGIACER
ncbi:excalibur calcium-binding domain-containing protein [Nocardioides guangzhouensis]|nr:excalibur calcium-binding domain-containing protein [Nocardioides guangzhouensis]